MLKQKTAGNLSEEEDTYVTGLLHDLRMRYINAAAKSPGGDQDEGESESK